MYRLEWPKLLISPGGKKDKGMKKSAIPEKSEFNFNLNHRICRRSSGWIPPRSNIQDRKLLTQIADQLKKISEFISILLQACCRPRFSRLSLPSSEKDLGAGPFVIV
jgi:hypothetical protein